MDSSHISHDSPNNSLNSIEETDSAVYSIEDHSGGEDLGHLFSENHVGGEDSAQHSGEDEEDEEDSALIDFWSAPDTSLVLRLAIPKNNSSPEPNNNDDVNEHLMFANQLIKQIKEATKKANILEKQLRDIEEEHNEALLKGMKYFYAYHKGKGIMEEMTKNMKSFDNFWKAKGEEVKNKIAKMIDEYSEENEE